MKEHRVRKAPVSNVGLVLQAVALLIALIFRTSEPGNSWLALPLSLASVALGWAAMLHLGRQWRVQAVVTEDHELVTTGPYRVVRHPVYLALFGMLLATILARTAVIAGLVAVAIYLAGTEIRVRAEDALLRVSFPLEFPAYEASVPAYLPGIR